MHTDARRIPLIIFQPAKNRHPDERQQPKIIYVPEPLFSAMIPLR
jgi:hypothetical protein